MNNILKDALQGSKVHKNVSKKVYEYVKPGLSIKEIIDFIETNVKEETNYDKLKPLNSGIGFPIGIGIALILGVLLNYMLSPVGDLSLLILGVVLVMVAILFTAAAYRKATVGAKVSNKGIALSIVSGLLMGSFYPFVANGISPNFSMPEAGMLTPYSAFVVMVVGALISNFLFNTLLMKKPFSGNAVSYSDYFKGSLKSHLAGMLGGVIWALGTSFNIIASGKAGFAISYGLGQGATLIAAIWGVLIWKEFKGAPRLTNLLIAFMFLFYVLGLVVIILSK